MGFAERELTRDGFLGGRLDIRQPRHGYRAATDPVLLAAAVPARAGQCVLELGCGAGVASLCLGLRVPGLVLSGLELQPEYAALARRNGAENGIALTVIAGDVAAPPQEIIRQSYDHVIANPPYFPAGAGTAAADAGREAALREATPLARWIGTGIRRLAPRGTLTVIQKADRLPDLLAALDGRMGSVQVLPLAARSGRPAGRVILRARKGGRAPFRLESPLIVHSGTAHARDGESFSPAVQRVFRDAAALDF